jgi:hypothetical protein
MKYRIVVRRLSGNSGVYSGESSGIDRTGETKNDSVFNESSNLEEG